MISLDFSLWDLFLWLIFIPIIIPLLVIISIITFIIKYNKWNHAQKNILKEKYDYFESISKKQE